MAVLDLEKPRNLAERIGRRGGAWKRLSSIGLLPADGLHGSHCRAAVFEEWLYLFKVAGCDVERVSAAVFAG